MPIAWNCFTYKLDYIAIQMTKVNCEKGPYIFQMYIYKVISFMVYAFLLAKFFSIRYMCIYQTWRECKDLRNTNTCQHLHKQHLHTGMLPMLIKIWLYLWDGHIIKLLLNTVLFTAPRGYFFLWELSVGPKTKHKEHALSHPMGLKSNILPQRQISNLALFYVCQQACNFIGYMHVK